MKLTRTAHSISGRKSPWFDALSCGLINEALETLRD